MVLSARELGSKRKVAQRASRVRRCGRDAACGYRAMRLRHAAAVSAVASVICEQARKRLTQGQLAIERETRQKACDACFRFFYWQASIDQMTQRIIRRTRYRITCDRSSGSTTGRSPPR